MTKNEAIQRLELAQQRIATLEAERDEARASRDCAIERGNIELTARRKAERMLIKERVRLDEAKRILLNIIRVNGGSPLDEEAALTAIDARAERRTG